MQLSEERDYQNTPFVGINEPVTGYDGQKIIREVDGFLRYDDTAFYNYVLPDDTVLLDGQERKATEVFSEEYLYNNPVVGYLIHPGLGGGKEWVEYVNADDLKAAYEKELHGDFHAVPDFVIRDKKIKAELSKELNQMLEKAFIPAEDRELPKMNVEREIAKQEQQYRQEGENDKFYLHDDGRIEQLYYNPDGYDGYGQFVSLNYNYNDVLEAAKDTDGLLSVFFGRFEGISECYLTDNDGGKDFLSEESRFNGNEHNLVGCTEETMNSLVKFARRHEMRSEINIAPQEPFDLAMFVVRNADLDIDRVTNTTRLSESLKKVVDNYPENILLSEQVHDQTHYLVDSVVGTNRFGNYMFISYDNETNKYDFVTYQSSDFEKTKAKFFDTVKWRTQSVLRSRGVDLNIAPPIVPGKKNIYVCSPLSGNIQRNTEKARLFAKHVAENGGIPLAPHITGLFDDTKPEERKMGLEYGIDLLKSCNEVWVFGDRVSDGMRGEIEHAIENDIPVFHINERTFERSDFDIEALEQKTVLPGETIGDIPKIEKQSRPYYSYDEIKEQVKIQEVAEIYSLPITQKGGDWVNVRGENTPSCKIYPNNTFCDFGNGNRGGDVIAFAVYAKGQDLNNENYYAAAVELAEAFGIPPQNNYQPKADERTVQPGEWYKIGITPTVFVHPDNFSFDADNPYYKTLAENLYKKHGDISVDGLRRTDMKAYERLLRGKAMPTVFEMRSDYLKTLANVIKPPAEELIHYNHLEIAKELRRELTGAERVLIRAAKGTNIKFYPHKYDVDKDIEALKSGKKQVEYGTKPLPMMKSILSKAKSKTFTTEMTLDEYNALRYKEEIKPITKADIARLAADGYSIPSDMKEYHETVDTLKDTPHSASFNFAINKLTVTANYKAIQLVNTLKVQSKNIAQKPGDGINV